MIFVLVHVRYTLEIVVYALLHHISFRGTEKLKVIVPKRIFALLDRILGMFRTVVNVTGELTACLVFDRIYGAVSESEIFALKT
ncbi:dicarboxylate/amino acid:cation symporter [Flavobacteriaceae bacterium F89]|uniref:Dicarboxylate/amino acid:cation symporter n=1 Tax=Cerina litoralis TaxID=2874477 RepID=A0AAE3JNK9_9FLAO|nr:hypothetical protein [Cerina litoralis]MCG2459991.1 dicarboxylate/amino acid:cation symporter [Cerina litoralis]